MRPFLRVALPLLPLLLVPGAAAEEPSVDVRIVEVVADPLHDWNLDGKVTPSDEYVELHNPSPSPVDLTGWKLLFNDTSPTMLDLTGVLEPSARRLVVNPPGEINNNGHVALIRPDQTVADEVRFGTWTGSPLPSADANHELDEALSLVAGNWTRWHATPGTPNEEPRWDIQTRWNPEAFDGWTAPSASGQFSARAIHAGVSIDRLILRHTDGNVTQDLAEAAAGSNVPVAPQNGEFSWAVPDRAWNASAGKVRVDVIPPSVVETASPIWLTTATWHPSILDNESGPGDVQWRSSTGDEAPWATNLTLPVDWEQETLRNISIRARDRVGNVGPWTNATLGKDPVPPPPPNVTVQGRNVEWNDHNTQGAPIVEWHVRRIHTVAASWILPANVTRHEDSKFDPGRSALAYEVRGLDAAGNLGAPRTVTVDHDGLYPQVIGIRITRPWWSSGMQEVRIDFDRRMDTSTPPTLDLPAERIDESRWFANASTFYVASAAVDAWPEGGHAFTVANAKAADGMQMRRGGAAAFHVDRTDPVLVPSLPPGWVSASHITVNVTDASTARVSWKIFPQGSAEPAGWNETEVPRGEVTVPGNGTWVLKATAKDRAGNSATQRWTYKVDRVVPTLTLSEAQLSGRQTILVADADSGIDWATATTSTPAGWTLRTDPSRKRVLLEPAANASGGAATVAITDQAGNRASLGLTLSVPEPPEQRPAILEASDGAAAARLAAMATSEAEFGEKQARIGPGAWWTAGLVGSTAVSVPLVRRAKRRRKKVPSFARRIREAKRAA